MILSYMNRAMYVESCDYCYQACPIFDLVIKLVLHTIYNNNIHILKSVGKNINHFLQDNQNFHFVNKITNKIDDQ